MQENRPLDPGFGPAIWQRSPGTARHPSDHNPDPESPPDEQESRKIRPLARDEKIGPQLMAARASSTRGFGQSPAAVVFPTTIASVVPPAGRRAIALATTHSSRRRAL